jgi:aspartyl-tRNA(Asn)/glutamyl-tRNA(Gln) amidotransferase subunit A
MSGDAELRALSAAEVARAIKDGELSATEVVEAHCAALESLAPLGALITDCSEQALARAGAGVSGPLAGVPVIVKDIVDTAGVRTTYGSRIYAEHVPAENAWVVARIEDAGALVIAKANLHEFAWGITSQNPHWGYVHNPARPGCTPGGSSGGNAAALAAGVGVLGLGSDSGGSIRIPSACCGTVGFKPAHGVVSTAGCFPLAPSFDVVGPMARTVADCALAYSVMSGTAMARPRLDGLVVGILEAPADMSPYDLGNAPERGSSIEAELSMIEALGARLVHARLEPAGADMAALFLSEAASSHRATFPARRDEYGPDTQVKWDAALAVPEEAANAARRELPGWRRRALLADGPDLYVSPTLARAVPELDVWEPEVRTQMLAYTRPFNFLGWPSAAIGGLQLAGRNAEIVLGAALAWEDAYGTVPLL